MAYVALDRFGNTIHNPTPAQMEQLLASFSWGGVDNHPEVSIIHETGWRLKYYPSGLLLLENAAEDKGPWHMRGLSREVVKEMWLWMASGELEKVGSAGWLPGYGA